MSEMEQPTPQPAPAETTTAPAEAGAATEERRPYRRPPSSRPGGPGSGGGDMMGRGGDKPRRFKKRRKMCAFCVDKANVLDYKDVSRLRRFVTERGKIIPRRQSGTCAKHQRSLASAIKKARECALLPYVLR